MKAIKDLFVNQKGMSGLVVLAILAAAGGIITYGIVNYLGPKVKGGGDSAGSSIDDATSLTY